MNFNVSLKRVVDDSYDIEIGYSLFERLVSDLQAGLVGSRRHIAVITDDTVEKLYAGEMLQKLADAGFNAQLFVIPSGEKSILQLISVRLLCAAAKDHRYAETMIELSCGGETFKKNGKIVLSEGWKGIFDAFYKQKEDVDRMQISVPAQNTALPITSTALKEAKTSPMKHFTEDTLLRAMETAGADEIPDETERKGLGTPATRAATIEKLVQRGFLERRGDKKTRHLVATEKGNSLITVMPEQIQSASMTAEWETKLLRVQQGELSAKEFMEEIEAMIADLVRNYKNVRDSEMLMKRKEKHYGRKLE